MMTHTACAFAFMSGIANIRMMLATVIGKERMNHGRSLPWRQTVLSRTFAIRTLVIASISLETTGKITMKLAIHRPRLTVKPRVSVRNLLK